MHDFIDLVMDLAARRKCKCKCKRESAVLKTG
jgi:hypothetical protein